MFLHMKAGLDADPIRLDFSPEAYELRRSRLTPRGEQGSPEGPRRKLRTGPEQRLRQMNRPVGLMACADQTASQALPAGFSATCTKLSPFNEPVAGTWPIRRHASPRHHSDDNEAR